MAFTSYLAYQNARDSGWQHNPFSKGTLTVAAGRLYSSWKLAAGSPAAGANPGATAISYDSTVAGALVDIGGGTMRDSVGVARVVKMGVQLATSPGAGLVQLCDRISGISTFSGLTTGTVTSNTVAPTRYAAGAASNGILAAIEIYTALGATAGTINMLTYTDQAGTTGKIGAAVAIGNTGNTEVGRMLLLPTESGGLGVRSVETLNRVTAMASAGDYGVTVFKPLVTIPVHSLGPAATDEEVEGLGYILPTIVAGACLFFTFISAQTTTTIFHGEVTQGEE